MTGKKVPREVELVNEDRRKNGKRKKISPERQQLINERIELGRELLRKNWTLGDIKRAFKQKYGLGYRTVDRYLRLARNRNLEILDRSEDEVTAYSVGFWAKQQRDCAERIQQARQAMSDANTIAAAANAILDSPNASTEKQQLALARIKEANKQLDGARRTIYAAEQTAMSCQDRLDKICAPGKYNTAASPQDLQPDAGEPVSSEAEQKELQKILDEITQRTPAETCSN